jgi:hypothetical protein
VYLREGIAVAGWPAGLLSNTVVEARLPGHRSSSILFRDTYEGAGVQILATPAFVTAGPRISLAPVDAFDVNFKAARGWYFANGLGLVPFESLSGTLDADRNARKDEGVGAGAWILTVEPTLKAQVGPVIAFDAWTVDWMWFERPAGAPALVYEPFRDLVIAWDDVAVEHHAAVFWSTGDDGGAMLRLGPTWRDRWTLVSHDRSATTGLMVVGRPGRPPAVPALVGLALWYVIDVDRVGPVPFMAAQVRWEWGG